MEPTTLGLALMVVVGVAAIAAGLLLLGRARPRAERPSRAFVEPPAHTDGPGRRRILDRAVFLALELSRIDGAIGELEMRAIEDYLVDGFALTRDEAERLVHQVLRATLHTGGIAQAVSEIERLADVHHRELVYTLLDRVARADGQLVADERELLEMVAGRLGQPAPR